MRILRRNLGLISALAGLAFLAAACGKINYAVPDEYMGDGELLAASMEAAVSQLGENRVVQAENGPFALESLVEGEYDWLYSRFQDVLAQELSNQGLEVLPEPSGEETTIKYRLIESRVVNAKADRGQVRRIGHTVAHIRVYGSSGELFWAGEYEGDFDNVVPKGVVSKLVDERIEQIGPQQPEAGQNPFVEPLLVTGITGALIYLFAVSASAE